MPVDVLEELRRMQLMIKDLVGLMIQRPPQKDEQSPTSLRARVTSLEREVQRQNEAIKTLHRQMQASIDCHLRGREALSALTASVKKLSASSPR